MSKLSVKKLDLDERIRLAAEWLLGPRHDHVINELKERFDLSAAQAVAAIQRANEMRARS